MGNLKVMTILGTRPEIIRLSLIIQKLDQCCDHILVHTGQNYDHNLNELFFKELRLRSPDEIIDSKADSLGGQIANIFEGIEKVLLKHNPDKVLILGDTNTSLCTVIVERLGYPVYHMEAGNRCFDLKVPEEKNRRVIDAVSSFNLPYTPGSRENLIREGFPKQKIFETGNPIFEVLLNYDNDIDKSSILKDLRLESSPYDYVLVTAHRAENVDDENRLNNIIEALQDISKTYHVIFSCHPRTRNKLKKFNINTTGIEILEPLGFFDFVKLEKNAKCVISDSGTVQEECCLLNTPAVTIRDSTERPETVECGSNIVSGLEKEDILDCFNRMIKSDKIWDYPAGYKDLKVSDKVVNFVLGNQLRSY